jgi:hypothetical protein
MTRRDVVTVTWHCDAISLCHITIDNADAKVDEFVAMVEHARKIHRERETDYTPTRKRKREEEEADSDYSPTFKHEMERVDENMRRAPPRASQRMETRAKAATRRLEFELANLNAPVLHEIGESSSAAIMEISNSEWLDGDGLDDGQYGIAFIAEYFGVFVGVVLQCLERDFKYTTANILHVDASIVGILWPIWGIVVYRCYSKEDKSHLDNTVCEEENRQYGCMYVWNKIGILFVCSFTNGTRTCMSMRSEESVN